jgi:hypothetical protein
VTVSAYARLFTIEVLHPYFSAPSRLKLRFVPDAATQAWLTRTDCVVRSFDHLLHVYFEAARNGPARTVAADGGRVDLIFGVYALDRQFGRFTDDLPTMDAAPLTFLSEGSVKDGEALRLATAKDKDAVAWSEGPRPDFIIAVTLADNVATDEAPGPLYRVTLKSRESFWKYILLGDWTQIRVVDPQSAVVFEDAADATLPDGRVVHAVRSKKAIPLAERFEHRFELHAVSAASGEAPFKRVLPTPAPANLARDRTSDGRELLVSEIFVPR